MYDSGAQNRGIYLEELVYYSYMLKLQSPSKYSPHDVVHLLSLFFHCSKQCLNSSILMSFHASAVFLFQLFHIGKMFPFEDIFHPGKQKEINCSQQDWVPERVGPGVHAVFGQKTAEHAVLCGQVC